MLDQNYQKDYTEKHMWEFRGIVLFSKLVSVNKIFLSSIERADGHFEVTFIFFLTPFFFW